MNLPEVLRWNSRARSGLIFELSSVQLAAAAKFMLPLPPCQDVEARVINEGHIGELQMHYGGRRNRITCRSQLWQSKKCRGAFHVHTGNTTRNTATETSRSDFHDAAKGLCPEWWGTSLASIG